MKTKLHFRYLPAAIAVLLVGPVCLAAKEARKIKPADTLPKTTPWDLKALSEAPAFKWTESSVKGARALHFTGPAYKGKPTRVFAYYATPGSMAGDASKDKNLPAVVLVHGGGGTAFDQWAQLWAKRGYAAIAMDLAGCGPKRKRLADGGPDQGDGTKFGAIDQPNTDQWTYHAVANVILAHSLIQSFDEVDADRTALTGISWGGYLTCIVMGLDNRFKASVPVYGCGFLHENSCWLNHFKKMSAENRAKWVRLWDPSSYAGSAAMPVLFVNGGKDFAYPPDSHAKTAALVKAPGKNIRFSPNLRHGHIFDRPKAVEVFIGHYLKGGVALPLVGPPVTANGKVTADVKTSTKLTAAALCYTTEKLPGNPRTRKWIEQPATIAGNRITAEAPPKDATIWFLTVTDERKTTVSSKLMFGEKTTPLKIDVFAADQITAIMHKVNNYQLKHLWRSSDRNWIRATWYTGVIAFHEATADARLLEQAVAWAKKHKWQVGTEVHPANRLTCVQTYLQIYFLTGDKSAIAPSKKYMDSRLALTEPAYKRGWGYIDTLYVGPPAFAMMSRATGDRKYNAYMNRVFREVADYLYDKGDGLFYRDNKARVKDKSPNGKKVLWSRGNGWIMGGLPRILRYLPKDDSNYKRYEELLKTMAASLAKRQGSDGLWRANLGDDAHIPTPESSGSGFFTYAMAWGVNNGVLDRKTYLPVVRRAWKGLCGVVDESGRVCWGQLVGRAPYTVKREHSHEYVTGTFLLAGSEMLKMARGKAGAKNIP